VTIDAASIYTGIVFTLLVWLVLTVRAYRALRLQHSLQVLRWWLPAAAGALATLLAYNIVFPFVLNRYTHIADIVVTIGISFSVVLGLVLTKSSNVFVARAFRSGTDLKESQP
jgi:hypothetical protein